MGPGILLGMILKGWTHTLIEQKGFGADSALLMASASRVGNVITWTPFMRSIGLPRGTPCGTRTNNDTLIGDATESPVSPLQQRLAIDALSPGCSLDGRQTSALHSPTTASPLSAVCPRLRSPSKFRRLFCGVIPWETHPGLDTDDSKGPRLAAVDQQQELGPSDRPLRRCCGMTGCWSLCASPRAASRGGLLPLQDLANLAKPEVNS